MCEYTVIAQRARLALLSDRGWFIQIQLNESAFTFDTPEKPTAVLEYLDGPKEKGAIVDGIGFARVSDGNVVYIGCVIIETSRLHSHFLTLHGEGKLVWLNQYPAIYEGHFEQSLRNGFGTMRYTNSDVYQGEWLDGARHGVGMLQEPEESYAGMWCHDQRIGYGEQTYMNGTLYTGYWDVNRFGVSGRSGLGIVHHPNQEFIQVAVFENDLKLHDAKRSVIPLVCKLVLLEHATVCGTDSCRFGKQCANMKRLLAEKNPEKVPGLKMLLREHAVRCNRHQCMVPMCCAFSIQDAHKQERQMCTKAS
jgi:hypothetical protein